ncbi:hypothetical protein pneo_cds_952 [Pandoravirus neocaledonia]|uniref:Uncharacterized protein n=1 Tax=Pandoravirus neocaledonia TaxID=2107708 RepID=A0A2U7UDL1_9VIRU|nr:hypothetical protein pneo_cds_952 [Pandoravirus neocaledonia]AVK76559.1 hypothetical protein pneo_cds_952 [Pandoravirus neocaledonia]
MDADGGTMGMIIEEPWVFGPRSPDPPSDDVAHPAGTVVLSDLGMRTTPHDDACPEDPHATAATRVFAQAPDDTCADIADDDLQWARETVRSLGITDDGDDGQWTVRDEEGRWEQTSPDAAAEPSPDADDVNATMLFFSKYCTRKRAWWTERGRGRRHRPETAGLALATAVPLRLYVRGPSPRAIATAAAAFGPVPWMHGDAECDAHRATAAPCMDPHLLHAPSTMVDNAAYIAGRSAYVAVQHEALQLHRDRGMRLLADAVAAPVRPMDLHSVLGLYTRRLAIARVHSLRRRVVALSALYDHATRGMHTVPEAVRVASATTSGVEMAAAWYARWAATAAPLQTADQPYEIVVEGADRPDARPVAWVPVAGNTGVPLAAGVPVFYVGRVNDPLVCPVHRDADGHPTCPPDMCAHRLLLDAIAATLHDPWSVDARLIQMVAADADTVEFAMRVRAIVNDTIDRARRLWGQHDRATLREPVDLFSECPVDAFVLVRTGADGALLSHAIGVVPRFDIELCL